jgi:60 kDa SS-A/Ro ribonucleoprotein
VALLPDQVQAFEAFKADPTLDMPDVPFQILTALSLTKDHWTTIAKTVSWQMLRQNINSFAQKVADIDLNARDSKVQPLVR